MDAGQVIEALIRAGMHAKTAFEQARAQNGGDWGKFVESDAFKAAQKDVSQALDALTQSDVSHVVQTIREKQQSFLKGRAIAELPIAELLQFGQLADAEGVLVRQEMKELGAGPRFMRFLVDELLPTLVTVVKVVLPILL